MTSISFPFFVGLPDPQTRQPRLNDAEFRYTTKTARQLDKAAGQGIEYLLMRGQLAETLVLVVCYGLKHAKVPYQGKSVEITEEIAEFLIDEFIAAGGDASELRQKAFEALNASGVYGKPKPTEGADPLAPTPATGTPADVTH